MRDKNAIKSKIEKDFEVVKLEAAVTVCGANSLDANPAVCPVCNTPGKKVRPETPDSSMLLQGRYGK